MSSHRNAERRSIVGRVSPLLARAPGLTPPVLLQATGKTATEYMSEETTMTAYANLHLLLEQMRIRAHRSKRSAAPHPDDEASHYRAEPSRALVMGPESSGKTTACKILTNYAVRGPTPAYPLMINLDPGGVRPWFFPVALH